MKLPNIKLPGFLKKIKLPSFLSNKEILKRIGVTLFIVFIYRALANIPLPGVDMNVYNSYFGQSTASEINYLFTIFTGGRVDTPSLVGLGIAAYINASIVMQILPYAIPRLKELQKEGERGRQVINQITRYISFPLALFYSIIYLYIIAQRDFANAAGDPTIAADPNHTPVYLIQHAIGSNLPSLEKILFMALILTAGTIFLMWLSEIITERGLGNGSSVIITIGILSTLPVYIGQDFSRINFGETVNQLLQGNFSVLSNPITTALLVVIIGAIVVIAGIIFINESYRKIDIQYARRVRGAEIGRGSFLPLKFTLTGVIPVIFTYAVLSIPQILIPLIQNANSADSALYKFAESLKTSFLFAPTDNIVDGRDFTYSVIYFILTIVFALVYAFIVFNPQEVAVENLQKNGAFIPGVRPGKSTENYLTKVLLRIGLLGGIFLGFIALIPMIARDFVLVESGTTLTILSGIGGTSVLIIVGVFLDTYRQYRSLQATRNYEKYIAS
jgi:preprotein translocase subunit SecY